MNVIRNENIKPFDVDGTLVYYDKPAHVDGPFYITDPLGGPDIKTWINYAMVRILKEEHARGGYIVIWSRGGYAWAETVIKALKLTEYVHQIMTKPLVYYDDSPVDTWLQDRVFLVPGTEYKPKDST